MADDKHDHGHIRARDARDRLIDILGFGRTYPLRDVHIHDESLTVPFDSRAQIPIQASQKDVLYQLRDHRDGSQIERVDDGETVAVEGRGNGETLVLSTPKIVEDITYNVLARKIEDPGDPGDTGDTGEAREAYLLELAEVKVGLDVGLSTRIDAPLLERNLDPVTDTAPRIVDYGEAVDVAVDLTQEGVMYSLVDNADPDGDPLSVAEVRGDLGTIVLRSVARYEDIDLRVRARKSFEGIEGYEGREDEIALLDAVLPLKVRADRDVAVRLDGAAVIDYSASTGLVIEASQKSADYRLFAGEIADGDFLFGSETADSELSVSVPDESAEGGREAHEVRMRRPELRRYWKKPDGFANVSGQKRGTGGTLRLPTGACTTDQAFVVRAQKRHENGPLDGGANKTIKSNVQLVGAAMVLVRPNPEPGLWLRTWLAGSETNGSMMVVSGQPGCFYEFRDDGEPTGLPAYFHQKLGDDTDRNKGVGQLRIGVDAAIARNMSTGANSGSPTVSPPNPLLATDRLALGTELTVRATRAQTGVGQTLATATLATVPEMRAEPATIAAGESTRIVVVASRLDEKYQLVYHGKWQGEAQSGTGGDLSLATEPLDETTTIAVMAMPQGSAGIPVQRAVYIRVTVGSG